MHCSKSKEESKQDVKKIPLGHNFFLAFTTEFNSRHIHKLVLSGTHTDTTEVMFLTFRMSKTFVNYSTSREGYIVKIINGPVLRLANEDEKKVFFDMKKRENEDIGFEYPQNLDFTLSIGDMLMPEQY
jgi:hypothetical protein